MLWKDLNLELLNHKNEWVKVISVKPEEFLIAWNDRGKFVWCDIRTTEIRTNKKEI
jgi:hypothetical protein